VSGNTTKETHLFLVILTGVVILVCVVVYSMGEKISLIG